MDREFFRMYAMAWVVISCIYLTAFAVKVGFPIAQEHFCRAYSFFHQKTTEFNHYLAEEKVKEESRPEWAQNQRELIGRYQRCIVNQRFAIEKGKKELRENSKLSEFEIAKVFVEGERELREVQRLHDRMVANFNTAIMRYSHGSQYKGAEQSMI